MIAVRLGPLNRLDVGIWEVGHTAGPDAARYIGGMHSARTSPSGVARAAVLEAAAALHMEGADAQSPARLISQLCDERLDATALATRIEAHPVLCARLLKVANSAYYGQARCVGTVKAALLLLGVNAVRGIAAAACIRQVMPRRLSALPDLSAFMTHSLATAIACDRLATLAHPHLAGDAFIAGLIHNLGTVVQASLDSEGTGAITAARASEPWQDIRSLEQRYSRIGHEECAGILFGSWDLPHHLVMSALHHHAPDDAPEHRRPLATLVWAGAHLALNCGNTYSLEPQGPPRDDSTLFGLGVLPEQLEVITTELASRVALLSRAFD